MNLKTYFRTGEAYVWLNAGAVTLCLMMIVGILGLIAVRGMSHFWPANVMEATYHSPDGTVQTLIGELYDEKTDPASRLTEAGLPVPEGIAPTEPVTRWSIWQSK